MFQFTTTNVINVNQDLGTNKSLWSLQEATDDKGASLNIKRIGNFCADYVTDIFKAEATDPVITKATLDLNSLADKAEDGDQFRLSLYIRLSEGSNYSLYSNDFYFKGLPFSIDFIWKTDAATTAKKLEDTVRKYMLSVYNEKVFSVKAEGTTLVIEGVNEYQYFSKANIEKLDPKANHGMGEYTVVVEGLTAAMGGVDGTNLIELNKEGFGTYSWILHNLRLPTTAHTNFAAVQKDHVPVVGAKYNQYTIHYCVKRGTLGTNAVGDQVTSHTTHVFYVNQDIAAEFEAALGELGDIKEIPA